MLLINEDIKSDKNLKITESEKINKVNNNENSIK